MPVTIVHRSAERYTTWRIVDVVHEALYSRAHTLYKSHVIRYYFKYSIEAGLIGSKNHFPMP
jgi:hypothetical protein